MQGTHSLLSFPVCSQNLLQRTVGHSGTDFQDDQEWGGEAEKLEVPLYKQADITGCFQKYMRFGNGNTDFNAASVFWGFKQFLKNPIQSYFYSYMTDYFF